jgi:uncharacterized protein
VTGLVPSVLAALVAGCIGSVHCLGMCAGISGLFAAHAGAASLRAELPKALAYNGARVLSYASLGALAGGFGGVVISASPAIAAPVRILSGIVIVLVGLQVAVDLRMLHGIERMGGALWAKLAPAARVLVPVTSLPRALGLGLLWGFLPCGLVYSVLLVAATSSGAAAGASIMLAFGAGTMPAMILSGIGTAQLSRLTRRRALRTGLGLLIVALGVLTIAMPLASWLSATPHQHGP